MNFELTKTEQLFRQMIREFAENEVKPLAAEIDEEERFPVETVEKMAKLGIFGIPFPVNYGGAGGNNILYSMAVEEPVARMRHYGRGRIGTHVALRRSDL